MRDSESGNGREQVWGGAYGATFRGCDPLPGLRPAPPADWPAWTVTVRTGDVTPADGIRIDRDEALMGITGDGEIRLSRTPRSIRILTRAPLPEGALAHPVLSVACMAIVAWSGRMALHGSAVVIDGRTWAILGDREAGKSTTTALLAGMGHPTVTDDLVVVEGRRVFAGPPSIDLREDAAADLGGAALGRIGRRDRWRVAVADAPHEVELAGTITLAWGDRTAVETVPAADRFPILSRCMPFPVAPDQVLDVASLPLVRFTRPRRLSTADLSVGELVRELARYG